MFRPDPTDDERELLDDRINDEASFEVDEYFSSTNTAFSESDPAKEEQKPEEAYRNW